MSNETHCSWLIYNGHVKPGKTRHLEHVGFAVNRGIEEPIEPQQPIVDFRSGVVLRGEAGDDPGRCDAAGVMGPGARFLLAGDLASTYPPKGWVVSRHFCDKPVPSNWFKERPGNWIAKGSNPDFGSCSSPSGYVGVPEFSPAPPSNSQLPGEVRCRACRSPWRAVGGACLIHWAEWQTAGSDETDGRDILFLVCMSVLVSFCLVLLFLGCMSCCCFLVILGFVGLLPAQSIGVSQMGSGAVRSRKVLRVAVGVTSQAVYFFGCGDALLRLPRK